MKYQTKDSGQRKEFSSGMKRDSEQGKPRFELLILKDLPYEEQMLTRFAGLLARGAEKYESRNFEKAETQEELDRFKESAARHFFQWICNEDDEDHASAVWFNIMGAEMVKWKMRNKKPADSDISDCIKSLHKPVNFSNEDHKTKYSKGMFSSENKENP